MGWKGKAALLAVVVAIAVILCGCAGMRGLVTARVTIASGTNRVEVVQPKDTTIDRLSFDPQRGVLVLDGYASSGNAAAIAAARAQAEAQAMIFGQAVDLVGKLGVAAGRAYGLPMGGSQDSVDNTPPAGWKWTLGTNGMPVLRPKDDPSTPRFE